MPGRKTTSAEGNVIKIQVSPKIGNVSAIFNEATDAIALLTLAHGAGTDMNHKFMNDLSSSLAALQISTLRFNFPYTENGRKMPDRAPVATAAVKSVLEYATTNFSLPLFAGGKSFGGRMTSHTLAENSIPSVRGLMF